MSNETPTPAPCDEREREQFEAAYPRGVNFQRNPHHPEFYLHHPAQAQWVAWSKRAALAEAELAEVREQNRILRLGVKGDFDLDAWLDWAKEAEGLRAELERVNGLLSGLVEIADQKMMRHYGKIRDGSPNHRHDIPGVWDSDNGPLAGKPCAECAMYDKARAAIDAARGVEG